MGTIKYVQPNEIGYIELSKEEKKIIKKTMKHSVNPNILTILFFSENRIRRGLPLSIFLLIFLSVTVNKIDRIEWIVLFVIYCAYILCMIMLYIQPKKVEYTASAYGTVVKKEIVPQKVIKGMKYTYKKFSNDNPVTSKPVTEQDFYYLTLKLADGRYVRHVNCLRDDFLAVSEGDTVLAVCYGFNEIKGYII
ncbi:MAG: hypothetical protein NC340_02615 [Ruminococcus flavefaciens]|nr:hypothetical protein [Ruminococcus flavefaciens]MCM1229393.1 hypothetical protein [Ruminococcus flavefaciens]